MKTKINVQEGCNNLLDSWIESDNGRGMYKLTGGYWEVLYHLLQKYAPEKLKQYADQLGVEFDTFNEQVKEIIDTGDEEENLKNALSYMNWKIENYSTEDEPQLISTRNDEMIPYLPNQSIDPAEYFGREE